MEIITMGLHYKKPAPPSMAFLLGGQTGHRTDPSRAQLYCLLEDPLKLGSILYQSITPIITLVQAFKTRLPSLFNHFRSFIR